MSPPKPQVDSLGSFPTHSAIVGEVPDAYFHDCHRVDFPTDGKSALEIYLAVASITPGWVNVLMALRNRVVLLFGLKNLGQLDSLPVAKPASAYRVGDRVGIFSLLYLADSEVVLGDSDKHLRVKVSVCKVDHNGQSALAVATLVHVHNVLGRVYMFFVAPVHKIIVRAMLKRMQEQGNAQRRS